MKKISRKVRLERAAVATKTKPRCTNKLNANPDGANLQSHIMKTARQAQRFKALKRKELPREDAAGRVRIENFTLAAANKIKRQPLDVSGVEILEHEISPDN